MTLEDSLKVERKQWLKEGREEGREEKGFEAVRNLVESGLADEIKACEILEVSLEQYKKYKGTK